VKSFGLWLLAIFCSGVSGQSTSSLESEFASEVDLHLQLSPSLRLLIYPGLEQGTSFSYHQVYGAAGIGYQLKQIAKPHLENIDPDKERYFVFAAGYEYLRTSQSGKTTDEDRVVLDGTLGFRPISGILTRDRSWIELRWVNGKYSTRYRNRLILEQDFVTHGLRWTPYAFAEVFYDGSKSSWNQEWFSGGVQWPYKKRFMLDTHYRRQHCTTCNPTDVNLAGVALNFYFGKRK